MPAAKKKPSATATRLLKLPHRKRTSQGLVDKPKGKHKRKNWKRYRGQGRP